MLRLSNLNLIPLLLSWTTQKALDTLTLFILLLINCGCIFQLPYLFYNPLLLCFLIVDVYLTVLTDPHVLHFFLELRLSFPSF